VNGNGEKTNDFCNFVLDYYLYAGYRRGNLDISLLLPKGASAGERLEAVKETYRVRKELLDSFVATWFGVKEREYKKLLSEKLNAVLEKITRKEKRREILKNAIDDLSKFFTLLEFLALSLRNRKLFKEFVFVKNALEKYPEAFFGCFKDSEAFRRWIEGFISETPSRKIKYYLPIIVRRLKGCIDRRRKLNRETCGVQIEVKVSKYFKEKVEK